MYNGSALETLKGVAGGIGGVIGGVSSLAAGSSSSGSSTIMNAALEATMVEEAVVAEEASVFEVVAAELVLRLVQSEGLVLRLVVEVQSGGKVPRVGEGPDQQQRWPVVGQLEPSESRFV